jgi:hypothetical protein
VGADGSAVDFGCRPEPGIFLEPLDELAFRSRGADVDHMAGIEAQIGAVEPLQVAYEDAGDHQQNQAGRYLAGNQPLADPPGPRVRMRPGAGLHSGGQVDPGRPQSGRKSKKDSSGERQRGRKEKDPPIRAQWLEMIALLGEQRKEARLDGVRAHYGEQ